MYNNFVYKAIFGSGWSLFLGSRSGKLIRFRVGNTVFMRKKYHECRKISYFLMLNLNLVSHEATYKKTKILKEFLTIGVKIDLYATPLFFLFFFKEHSLISYLFNKFQKSCSSPESSFSFILMIHIPFC